MELTAAETLRPLALSRRLIARLDPPALAAWVLAFTLVFYLALSNGGYDAIVRDQVGIAVWWIVLLGALAGILPWQIRRAGWAAVGLLAAFGLWTTLAIGWSESAERSTIELARVATYLGVLLLAIVLQGRAAAQHTINGVGCAIGVVTLLAVLSRLHPQWFPVNDQVEFLGAGIARKLSYPLNYWNALAAFAAIGVPLLLGVAVGARTLAGQALAAATLPLSALCVYLTISRGGVLALVVGMAAFLLFVPRRVEAMATLLVGAIGSAILLSAAAQQDAVQDGVRTATAIHEGTQLLWLAVVVCGGVALFQIAIGLAARHVSRPRGLSPSRRTTTLGALGLLVVVCVIGVSAGVPAALEHRWDGFKQPPGTLPATSADNVFSRLQGASGNYRYQYWQSARDANATDPWKGIGPGTFEFWWARHGTTSAFVRDAHTLYFETLAETGIVGFVLLVGLLLFLLGTALVRCLRGPPEAAIWIAAAVGGLAAFMTSAAFEWVWEIGAIACAVMLLAAVIVAGHDRAPVALEHPKRPRRLLARVVCALLAVAAIGAVGVPMAGALATRESRNSAAQGNLAAALEASRTAERVQPYAATAHLQRALVLEEGGALSDAARAATSATADEPTNWRTWLVLARIEARRGLAASALEAFRTAKRLNQRSALLNAR
jgi:O-antigen ligase